MTRNGSSFRLLAALCVAACAPDAAAVDPLIQHADDGAPATRHVTLPTAPTVAFEPGALPTVLSETVYDRTGPDGQPFDVALRTPDTRSGHARRFGMHTMQLQLRTTSPDLSRYPCTSCHQGRALVLADERSRDAHVAIRAVHPAETGATCATCHAPEDVELLALRKGGRTSLDHAYRVCAQCHFAQVDAWAAGAHGKRLDGWQGRRVVMGCADCHDPHEPALRTRLPFRPPRLHRPTGQRP